MNAAKKNETMFKQFCEHRLWSCEDIDNLLIPVMEYMVATKQIQDPDECMRIVLRKCPLEIQQKNQHEMNEDTCNNYKSQYRIFKEISKLYAECQP